jgi:two-component system OmpR family sensor kinase
MMRKLKRLGRAMADFRASGFRQPVLYRAGRAAHGDEIDRIGAAYNAMVERIDEQGRDLDRQDAARSDLLANLSHDLRTPLASLRGYLETLLVKDGSLSADEQRRFLEFAARQSERLGELLAELLELARLESRDFRINAEPVHLSELAQDVMQERASVARQQEISLTVQAPALLPLVRADIGLIDRALRRLIDDRIRSSRPGARVILGLAPCGERVRVELFYTGNTCQRTGPGIAIVKRILELHGAAVTVESAEQGTRFSFSLPIA